ncbi:hypothetical protein ES703_120379 [subsurface metagenome]
MYSARYRCTACSSCVSTPSALACITKLLPIPQYCGFMPLATIVSAQPRIVSTKLKVLASMPSDSSHLRKTSVTGATFSNRSRSAVILRGNTSSNTCSSAYSSSFSGLPFVYVQACTSRLCMIKPALSKSSSVNFPAASDSINLPASSWAHRSGSSYSLLSSPAYQFFAICHRGSNHSLTGISHKFNGRV